jgi:hypothetical protein
MCAQFVRNLKGRDCAGYLSVDRRIILKWITQNTGMRIEIVFNWPRLGSSEPMSFIKAREFFDQLSRCCLLKKVFTK